MKVRGIRINKGGDDIEQIQGKFTQCYFYNPPVKKRFFLLSIFFKQISLPFNRVHCTGLKYFALTRQFVNNKVRTINNCIFPNSFKDLN